MTAGRTRRTLLPLAAAALAAAASGCFNSHNPSYFPYYIPGGRIQQEHAKPAFGYFRDFDPKACRLEVTPPTATAPLGSQVVLVATVSDKDGQPRRSRRVEWMLEGPGTIVEVDEAGFYAGRGYKVDNKYAVGYTNYTTHTITRGNDDPKDDVEICPGQTFCVVSSAVAGETTVTAYAPGVFNWEKGRVVTKVAWGEGRFTFPPSLVTRYGGGVTLTTSVTHFEQDGPAAPAYRVRYRVLDTDDGGNAVLVPQNGPGTGGSQTGGNEKEAEAPLDTTGAAAVRLVQSEKRAGKTRVAVEVVKPPEAGTGPGIVVGRRETVVEWAAPEVKLDVTAPPVVPPAGTVPFTVALANTSAVDARESRVRVTLAEGATLERSEPPPTRQDAGALVFDLPPLPAGKKQTVALQVRPPARTGPVTVAAEVVTGDGLEARKDATARVEAGKLGLHLEAPATALAGDSATVRAAVTNAGATPLANATVFARFDDALKSPDGKTAVELSAGTLAPGQTKTLDFPLTAKTTGRYSVRATATADGNVSATADPVALDVRRAELKVAVTAPKLAYLNAEFAADIVVANAGDAGVANAVVRATLPPEVRVKDAGGGAVGSGSVEWKVAELQAGDQKAFKLTLEGTKLLDRAAVTVVALADVGAGTDAVQARAEAVVAVIGTPAVVLELATPPGFVEVGKRATFEVRVKNRGTVSARNVAVTAVVTDELKAVRGTGKAEARVEAGGKVVFPEVEEIRPGGVATFTVEVEAARVGDARFRVEVRAGHLTNPLREEQSTRVTAPAR